MFPRIKSFRAHLLRLHLFDVVPSHGQKSHCQQHLSKTGHQCSSAAVAHHMI